MLVTDVSCVLRSTTQRGRPAKEDANAGLGPVQLRYPTGLTGEEYVTRQAWREASLSGCPLHPRGGCGFARHGTYARMSPPGTLIRRWYCPQGHRTFSLLPDHLAARFPGTLSEIEEVVATVSRARSVEAAANELRPDAITLASALRWVRRRLSPVRKALTILVGLFPQRLLGCTPRLAAVRERLGCAQVLVSMRALARDYLQALPPPLGFGYRGAAPAQCEVGFQQRMGPDPPRRIR